MEFGLFTEFQCPAGQTESDAFDESIAQSIEAERLGFSKGGLRRALVLPCAPSESFFLWGPRLTAALWP